jgi:N-acetylneuraminate lyase
MQSPLSGLVAAPFTPFRPDGELALTAIPQLGRLLHQNQVSATFVCGTTGEGSSLTTAERMQVAQAWRDTLPAGLKLTVHVGHLSLVDSKALARHAAAIGADAIATIAPSFFRPDDANALIAWCAEVAAAAPGLPFYYYHMPAMTGVDIPVRDFLAGVKDRIPSLVGVKFTHEDLLDYADARAFAGGRYSILFGRDEILLSGLQLGAPGAVGSTYNYAAPLYHRIMRAFAAGDLEAARRDQARAQQFIDIMNRHGGLPAGKTIMKFIGADCGPVRLPLRPLSPEAEKSFRAELDACGFFEYASRL